MNLTTNLPGALVDLTDGCEVTAKADSTFTVQAVYVSVDGLRAIIAAVDGTLHDVFVTDLRLTGAPSAC